MSVASIGPPYGEGAINHNIQSDAVKATEPQQRFGIAVAPESVLSWIDPSDPANPLNWSTHRKWINVALVSSQGLLSPLCSTILAVGSLEIAHDFNLTSLYTPNLPVGMYVLGLGLGPLFLAPLSEINGRRIVYLVSFSLFTVLQVGCALAPDITALSILRLAAGICGSAGTTLGGASIGDMFLKKDRGKAQAIYSLGPTTGPVIGPLIGAFIVARTHGWRWLMWAMVIAAGVVFAFCLAFLRETYAPFLLRRRARKARGKRHAVDLVSVKVDKMAAFQRAISRPLRLLFFSPTCTLMSLYMSLIYGILYLHLITLPLLYGPFSVYGLFSYRWQNGLTGLCFLGPAVGLLIGTYILAKFYNRSYASLNERHARKTGITEPQPENRLPFMQLGMITVPVGLIIFAWAAQEHLHWVVPLIGASLFTLGMLLAYVSIQTYLVDAYEPYGASALAAATFARGTAACVFPIVGFKLYAVLGYDWGTMLIALVCVVALPIPLILYRYGPRLRQGRNFNG